MRKVALTQNSFYTCLLSASVRLAEAGQDQETMRRIEQAKRIQGVEILVRQHVKDGGIGRVVRLSDH